MSGRRGRLWSEGAWCWLLLFVVGGGVFVVGGLEEVEVSVVS